MFDSIRELAEVVYHHGDLAEKMHRTFWGDSTASFDDVPVDFLHLERAFTERSLVAPAPLGILDVCRFRPWMQDLKRFSGGYIQLHEVEAEVQFYVPHNPDDCVAVEGLVDALFALRDHFTSQVLEQVLQAVPAENAVDVPSGVPILTGEPSGILSLVERVAGSGVLVLADGAGAMRIHDASLKRRDPLMSMPGGDYGRPGGAYVVLAPGFPENELVVGPILRDAGSVLVNPRINLRCFRDGPSVYRLVLGLPMAVDVGDTRQFLRIRGVDRYSDESTF